MRGSGSTDNTLTMRICLLTKLQTRRTSKMLTGLLNATLHSAEQAHNGSLDLTGRALASPSIVCKAALPYFIIKALPLNSVPVPM